MKRRLVVQTLRSPEDEVDPRVDLVELRLDLCPDASVAEWIAAAAKPAIACVRRVADGGAFSGSEAQRAALLQRARGAAYVDLELDADESLAPPGVPRVVSFHDVAGLPDDLPGVFQRCLLRGAAIVKIAATPPDAASAFRLLDLPSAGLGMGEPGAFTRVLAPLTYCARAPVAPGMPTPDELFDLYDVRRLGPRPPLFGIAGHPVAHSKSPAVHNAALARDGIDAVYLRFPVRDLAPFWEAFTAHGGIGLSVTAPLKAEAAALARSPDADVRECGAANTLLADGRAANTDLDAFLELLPRAPSDALVLGAGATARTAVVALRRLGHRVSVWARDPARARALGSHVAARVEPAPLVVNTTPLDPPAGDFVLDLRYGPGIAPPERGAGGMRFLRAQARRQYRLFTGRDLDPPGGASGILLVGPRGAGKTEAGRRLARRLGLPFADADAEVERETGASVAALLARGRFREAERRTLARLLVEGPAVLAAGGGAVLWEGLAEAAKGWRVVRLDADAETLARRIAADPRRRPSLTGRPPEEEIAAVAAEREPLYRRVAAARVDTSRLSPAEVVAEIERAIR